MKRETIVPVLMYHSIGIPNEKWIFRHLTCPYKIFESQLRWMKKKQFHTISLKQLYDHMNEGIALPKNPIVFTFDDGYLDNWVFAYPLLKKYGFNGTIYINPDFVDPRDICRKTLLDVWTGKIDIGKLETTGYLSWNEMKEMIKEGVMNIQSHAMTHTLYFKGNEIIDFRNPGDQYIWMTWNNHPDKKPYLQIDNDEFICYGEPVYEYGKSLDTNRFFHDGELSKYLITHIRKQGGVDFFQDIDWRKKLLKVVESYKKEKKLNEEYETQENYEKRVKYELEESKKIIEKKLQIDVKFLCWPVGGTTKKALEIASNVGYISSTAARDIKIEEKNKLKNGYGENPERIRRIGPTLYWNKIVGFKSKVKYKNGFFLVITLYSFQGKKFFIALNKFISLCAKTFSTIKFIRL